MTGRDKYDKITLGAAAGFVLPLVFFLFFYLFSEGHLSLAGYFNKIVKADIITHIISLSVLSNLILFLLFNRLDMLKATRGVLGITIFWAIIVFAVKFLA